MAVLLLLAAVAAIGIYLYRDSIARNVANSVLKDYDLAVTSLSIDSIGTDNIYFNELVLEQSSGTKIRVTGIALPTTTLEAQPHLLKVDQLELIPAGTSNQPAPIASILASILALPQMVPYSAVQVGRVTTGGIPPLTDVSWESTDAGQLLRFDVDSFTVDAGIEPASNVEHRVSITATTSDDVVALALALVVSREDARFVVSGQSTTRVAQVLPILHAVGMMPVKIATFDTLLRGVVNTAISDDSLEPVRVEATLTSDGESSLQYRIDDQSQMRVRVIAYSPTAIMIEYPSLDWNAQVDSGEMQVSTASVQDFPLNVTSLNCSAGIVCSMQANVAAINLSFAGIAIASATITAPISVTVDEQSQVVISGNTTAVLRDVSDQELALELIELGEFSGATIDVDYNGWHGHFDEAHFLIDGINAQPGIGGTLPLVLSDVAIGDSGEKISGAYLINSTAARLEAADLAWSIPDIEGTWQLSGDDFSASAALSSADGAIQAQFEARHHLTSRTGEIRIREASLDFGSRNLSLMMSPSPKNWDISSGQVSLDAGLAWLAADNSYQIKGSVRIDLDNIAGFRDDIAFAGLNSTLSADVDTQSGHEFQPSSLSLDLLDVGLPVSKIATGFQVGSDLSSVQVNDLSMFVLGGSVRTDPFNYSLEEDTNHLNIRIDAVQLSLMKSLAEFDSIDIEGSVSGVLPARIVGDRFIIDHGRFQSDDPGGAIRYRPGDADADDSQLGLATRALSNFEFETLTSDVSYNENGDLSLGMRLEGVNPEMDPNQPVVLNLNVENNVPEMLRSLQATRTIQEILEKRFNRE